MLSERIKALRKASGISQVDLAELLGVTKQSVSNWENDNIQPSIEMLLKLVKVFGVSSDYLLGIDNKKLLDVSELSDEELSHIKMLINDITAKK